MKLYIDPQGNETSRIPRFVHNADGSKSSLGINTTDAAWLAREGCTIEARPDPPPPEPPPMRAEVRDVAERVIALATDMQLPPPADFRAAIAATKGALTGKGPNTQARLEYAEKTLELLALRVELMTVSGTWQDVLAVAAEA